ncbi:IDE [Symbiodinium sp. CCMP2592]|nr:IDE [Symbiodinium sp. CCMP2592]
MMACRAPSPRAASAGATVVSRHVCQPVHVPGKIIYTTLPKRVVSVTRQFETPPRAHGAAARSVSRAPPKEVRSRPPCPPLPILLGREASPFKEEGSECRQPRESRESRESRARRSGGRRSGLESLERQRKPKEEFEASSPSSNMASSLQPVYSVQEGMAQRMEDFERQLAKVDELACRIEAMANTVEANIASTREEGSSSSTTTDPSMIPVQPVLSLLEGLSKRLEDFEFRFAKVDELACRVEAMANKVEANIASTREEGSSSSTTTDPSMIPVQPVLSLLEGLSKRLEDFEFRFAKVDELACRVEAMANKVEANIASTREEAWEARWEQLQAANIVASQRIENIDAQLAQLLERPTCPSSTVSAAVQTESEDKNLRETVEKQEFQLQLAAGDKLMLKDENSNCRMIALDALKEKNGYKAELAAAQRHLGFLTEGEELENQENEDPGQASTEAILEDSGEQEQQEELPRPHRASGPGWLYLYGEALIPPAAEGRIILKNEDMVKAYTAHFGQTPTPEQLRNWVKNSHGQAISYKEARNLIASAKKAKKQAK